jgi:hypothetical protein
VTCAACGTKFCPTQAANVPFSTSCLNEYLSEPLRATARVDVVEAALAHVIGDRDSVPA